MELKSHDKIRNIARRCLTGLMPEEDVEFASREIADKLYENVPFTYSEATDMIGPVIEKYTRSRLIPNAAACQLIGENIWEDGDEE